MIKGNVFNIQKYSLHDGPGIRTTIFMKGCPLKCIWCHNPESFSLEKQNIYTEHLCIHCNECLDVCPSEAINLESEGTIIDYLKCEKTGNCHEVCPTNALEMVGEEMTAEEVLREVEKDRVFYEESKGGVTFSGGEPLMQWEFVYEVAKTCKEKGIHTALDTSGFVDWKVIDRMREVIDLFLYDVKHLDNDLHIELTGVSNEKILENLERLVYLNEDVKVRIPIIPGLNNEEDHIFALRKWMSSIGVKDIHLLPYHRTGMDKYERIGEVYSIPHVSEPKDEEMKKIKKYFENEGLIVKIGG